MTYAAYVARACRVNEKHEDGNHTQLRKEPTKTQWRRKQTLHMKYAAFVLTHARICSRVGCSARYHFSPQSDFEIVCAEARPIALK